MLKEQALTGGSTTTMEFAKGKRPNIRVQKGAERPDDVRSVRKSVVFLVGVAVVYFVYLLVSGQWGAFIAALAGVNSGWALRPTL